MMSTNHMPPTPPPTNIDFIQPQYIVERLEIERAQLHLTKMPLGA